VDYIRTGNLIIRADSLVKFKVWFDIRFNLAGSEDSYFGIQMVKKDAAIFWSHDAIVFETIPESRANLKYLIKRHYGGASKFTYIMKLEKRYLKLLKKILISFTYTILGICGIAILPLPIKRKYWGILKLSEGIGGFSGFFNMLYKAYK
jgi:succinoglycan biosynthesis protein ExoM